MARIRLRDLCGVRSGDKGDISDLALFADDAAAYDSILEEVTAERVKAHFGALVEGPVERYEARNVLALKFVMHDALGGGAPRSLRADNLGKTYRWVQMVKINSPLSAKVDKRTEDGKVVLTARPLGGQRWDIVAAHWTFSTGS